MKRPFYLLSYIILIAAALLLAGCFAPPAPVDAPIFYISGDCGGKPCFWCGTTRTMLTLPEGGSYGGSADAIAVADDGTLYTVGWYGTYYTTPCYWAGATLSRLNANIYDFGFATAIAVANGRVTIGGWFRGDDDPKSWPCYWYYSDPTMVYKNGELAKIYGVAVVDSTVYTIGTSGSPCCWTGTVPTLLDTRVGSASAIAAVDGTRYIAGYYYDGALYRPCYWSGTNPVNLDLPSDSAGGRTCAIAVVNGIVYVAGYFFDGAREIPCFWAGTTLTRLDLPSDSVNGRATGIAVVDGTVHTCGYYYETQLNTIPCSWSGTTFTALDIPEGKWGHATGIAVGHHGSAP